MQVRPLFVPADLKQQEWTASALAETAAVWRASKAAPAASERLPSAVVAGVLAALSGAQ